MPSEQGEIKGWRVAACSLSITISYRIFGHMDPAGKHAVNYSVNCKGAPFGAPLKIGRYRLFFIVIPVEPTMPITPLSYPCFRLRQAPYLARQHNSKKGRALKRGLYNREEASHKKRQGEPIIARADYDV